MQQRDGRWVIADLVGKRGGVRTVPVPMDVKTAIDDWMSSAGIMTGPLLRRVNNGGRILTTPLSAWGVWSVVANCARSIGMTNLGAHDLRRMAARLPEERRRSASDQTDAGPCIERDDASLPRQWAGDLALPSMTISPFESLPFQI